jgi:hypothetical protein
MQMIGFRQQYSQKHSHQMQAATLLILFFPMFFFLCPTFFLLIEANQYHKYIATITISTTSCLQEWKQLQGLCIEWSSNGCCLEQITCKERGPQPSLLLPNHNHNLSDLAPI